MPKPHDFERFEFAEALAQGMGHAWDRIRQEIADRSEIRQELADAKERGSRRKVERLEKHLEKVEAARRDRRQRAGKVMAKAARRAGLPTRKRR